MTAVKNRTTAAPWPKIMKILTGVFCAFSGFCFFEYFLFTLSGSGGSFTYFALPIAAMLVVFLPPVLAGVGRKHLPGGLYRFVRGAYFAGVAFFSVTFVIFWFAVMGYGTETPVNEGPTAVLVYGCRTKAGEPRIMLGQRLDLAYDFLKSNPEAVAIVSGSVDAGEQESEAAVMAKYLTRRGISADRIYLDEDAESTKGNIRGFLKILEDEGMDDYHLISISSEFHIPRIVWLCGKYGLDCDFAGSVSSSPSGLFTSMVREYMAYVKMILLNDYS